MPELAHIDHWHRIHEGTESSSFGQQFILLSQFQYKVKNNQWKITIFAAKYFELCCQSRQKTHKR
jgi:hypothetical protein